MKLQQLVRHRQWLELGLATALVLPITAGINGYVDRHYKHAGAQVYGNVARELAEGNIVSHANGLDTLTLKHAMIAASPNKHMALALLGSTPQLSLAASDLLPKGMPGDFINLATVDASLNDYMGLSEHIRQVTGHYPKRMIIAIQPSLFRFSTPQSLAPEVAQHSHDALTHLSLPVDLFPVIKETFPLLSFQYLQENLEALSQGQPTPLSFVPTRTIDHSAYRLPYCRSDGSCHNLTVDSQSEDEGLDQLPMGYRNAFRVWLTELTEAGTEVLLFLTPQPPQAPAKQSKTVAAVEGFIRTFRDKPRISITGQLASSAAVRHGAPAHKNTGDKAHTEDQKNPHKLESQQWRLLKAWLHRTAASVPQA